MQDLPSGACERAFPFHVLIDHDGLIVALGDALRRICPRVHVGDEMLQHFVIERPLRAAVDWRRIADMPDSEFALSLQSYELCLSGPMVPLDGAVAFLARPAYFPKNLPSRSSAPPMCSSEVA
ncbi:MAG: hypothetical protein GY711_07900 [bacterium]|nr:hypothetical protein [bacterium]